MWDNLSEQEKIEFKKHCDSKFGKTIVFCETVEPLYLDKDMNMIDTKIVSQLLFQKHKN